MSLINKMLQDLDARGAQAGSALQSDTRPVALPERKFSMVQTGIIAGATVMAVAAVGFWLYKRPAVVAPPVVLAAQAAAPRAARIALAPAMVAPTVLPAAPPKAVAPPARAPVAARGPAVAAVPAPPAKPALFAGGRHMNDAQRAEADYRNALAALDDGRVEGAMAMLEQALWRNARHDAARQSLVALLIEAGRNDDAMAQLEQGLALDPAQPSMAMLLARMQIERGQSGVATLERSLPAAADNPDYQAFLAGALQRAQRHREALLHYGAALRSAPENGVWLMGMGMSLQAEKRNAEALDAFRRARASGTLTAPLAAFVERKIVQLAP